LCKPKHYNLMSIRMCVICCCKVATINEGIRYSWKFLLFNIRLSLGYLFFCF
jgi:hypothetical protein